MTCASCGQQIAGESAVYDDRECQYYCGTRCFDDWLTDNLDAVEDFYKTMNVTEVFT